VFTQTKPHRDRLIPFCCIDPRTSFTGGRKALAGMLKRYVDAGAKGFGEHKPGVKIDDPRNMALYEACGELRLPVLFHADTIRNVDAPGLPGLEEMLKEFPDTQFIGHATGWWSSISGDVKKLDDLGAYPKTPVVAGGAVDRLLEKYANIHGDLSAGSGAGALSRDLRFAREFLIRRADRLLFGTDYLTPGQEVPQFNLFRQLELPAEVQAKIFRDNARRLLRLGSG
jgi:predicted TIM-barrel fold metal-dependent hydrolase